MVVLETQHGERHEVSDVAWSELLNMARDEGWLDTHYLRNPQGKSMSASDAQSLAHSLEDAGRKTVGGATQAGIADLVGYLRSGSITVR
jgi:hypothetical protein